MRLVAFFVLLLAGSYASAACTGSGLTYTCTAGSTAANIQGALNAASDGATITLADGSYTLSSALSLNNIDGVTLICESVRGCTINYNSAGAFVYRDYVPEPVTALMRISGFIINGSPSTATIWLYGGEDITSLRIDNNTFQGQAGSTISILTGEVSGTGNVFGVIDNNIFTGTNNWMGLKTLDGTTWTAGRSGTANNLFFEDNTFTFTNYADLGTGGIDAWRASSVVFRYNSLTNARYVNHSYCHGGPVSVEVYGNTINAPDSEAPQYRNIHFQGSGEAILFDNLVYKSSSKTGGHVTIQHFRTDADTAFSEGSCDSLCNGSQGIDGNWTGTSPFTGQPYAGYPCWHQPGRDVNFTLRPVYSWRNRDENGAATQISLEYNDPDYFAENRDYYEQATFSEQSSSTSPFNGTSGVGYGTLANRPTTCTATPETADAGDGGVGYWATDAGGNWNTSNATANDGALYVCSSTNTWSLYYTPYTYPHPLRDDAGVVVRPEPPTNVVVTQVVR